MTLDTYSDIILIFSQKPIQNHYLDCILNAFLIYSKFMEVEMQHQDLA